MDQKLVKRNPPATVTRTAVHLVVGLCLLLSRPLHAGIGESPDIDAVFQFTLAPAGVTSLPDATWVLGVNQSERPRLRAVRIAKTGEVTPFPDEKTAIGEGRDIQLDAVEALQTDSSGIVWLLDNGRRSEVPPKLVGWNLEDNRPHQVFNLAPPAIVPGSFLADFAIDPESQLIFISDPASGSDAALLILDRTTGIARRFLKGHHSVIPDPTVSLRATRTGKETRRLDGTPLLAHTGIRSLMIDRKAQWLYYAPIQSRAVYRLPLALLRSSAVTNDKLETAIERYAEKPAAASLAIDNKNNIYVGDIEGRAIGCIEADKRGYRVLASDARLVWPDGLCFGQDGKLYFVSRTQSSLNTTRTSGPSISSEHRMFRLAPLAPGVPGT